MVRKLIISSLCHYPADQQLQHQLVNYLHLLRVQHQSCYHHHINHHLCYSLCGQLLSFEMNFLRLCVVETPR